MGISSRYDGRIRITISNYYEGAGPGPSTPVPWVALMSAVSTRYVTNYEPDDMALFRVSLFRAQELQILLLDS